MKKIYLLLTRSRTITARLVYFVTSDPYTHISFSFSEDLSPLYSSARKNGRTLFPAGPCKEDLRKGYYSKHPNIPCVLFALSVPDKAYESAKAEVQRIMDNASQYHYNIPGLLLCKLGIPHNSSNSFFCSQFAAHILGKSNCLKLPKDPSLMRPVDYIELPSLELLHRGTLQTLVQSLNG